MILFKIYVSQLGHETCSPGIYARLTGQVYRQESYTTERMPDQASSCWIGIPSAFIEGEAETNGGQTNVFSI